MGCSGSEPSGLARRFDRIVSAYVCRHFELREKVVAIQRLVRHGLAPSGLLVVADIS